MRRVDPEQLDGSINIAVTGELSRFLVARATYFAHELGAEPSVEVDMSLTVFPLLSALISADDYLGYEHFTEFNERTNYTTQNTLVKIFNYCIDPRSSLQRIHRQYSSDPYERMVHGLSQHLPLPLDGRIVKRTEVGLSPLMTAEIYDALPPLGRREKQLGIFYREYAIAIGGLIAAHRVPLEDNLRSLFLFSLSEQLRTQLES